MKQAKWWWVGIILLSAGAAWQWGGAYLDEPPERYAAAVEQRVARELRGVYARADVLAEQLGQDSLALFSELHPEAPYPYYVFRDGELVYWSTHLLVPAYDDLRFVGTHRYVSLPHGRFVAYRRRVGPYEVFFLMSVLRSYELMNPYLTTGVNMRLFPRPGFVVSPLESGSAVRAPNGDFIFSLRAVGGTEFGRQRG
ncbi:MAG: hypothetical protein WBA12_03595, partial [Catalinimonas sp.]